MLDDYADKQSIAYNIIKNAIINETIAHAYLFSAVNVKDATAFALSFAKSLLCPTNNLKCNKYDECSICHRIDNNNFPELILIEPDDLWIKKEELVTLKEELGRKPLEGDKRVYIISEIDKLNVHAANSILKFIEEPERNVIALFTTSKIDKVLPTIVSRCQLISLKSESVDIFDFGLEQYSNRTLIKIGCMYCKTNDDLKKFVEDEKNVEKLNVIVSFVEKYEETGLDVLLDIRKMWANYFIEKEDYMTAFDILILFYKDILNYMYDNPLDMFDYYNKQVKTVADLNNMESIIFKLQKIILAKEKIKYNVNLNMLMDKLLIEIESR